MKVVVIGGGPAGMMAAIRAKEEKNEVILLEKMSSLGKKLLITGKGRCNITSSLPMSEFMQNIPGNGRFLYSAFQNFTNQDILDFLKKQKVEVKEERGNRIFPVSDKAQDVLNAFIRKIKQLNIDVRTNAKVSQILKDENGICGVKLENGEIIEAKKVILATGGNSYTSTGSTGDGYKLAKDLGHTITKISGSLVPMTASKNDDSEKICKALQGLSLKNVKISILNEKKIIYEDFGEMLFTHFGVSGPTILSASSHMIRYQDIDKLMSENKIILSIDLKPALEDAKLEKRILRDFSNEKNKVFKNSLDALLPQKLIPVIIQKLGIDQMKKVNEITRQERQDLVNICKKFNICISGFRPVEEAIITAGGVSIKQINPKTMESKIVPGLFFAGEIIDVDGYTGGFNLQIAYSTGYTAGSNI